MQSNSSSGVRARPGGLVGLTLFFVFGTLMSGLAAVALAAPGQWSERLWRLNPAALRSFEALDGWAVPLMLLVATACAAGATGLWRGKRWGHRLAVALLSLNLVGDVANALFRGDRRTLVGLPIGGAMLGYLLSRRIRDRFRAAG